ncbi:MAG: hypothetical protein JST67_07825 [Bacteroidetes bacterium]|nr:hypothetical protein [Bacteroidota bacterium]
METVKQIILIIGGLVGTISLPIGLYQYHRQQKFKRLQNLSFIWRKFIDSQELLELFDLMNSEKIEEFSKQEYSKSKLKYLALLEEVALFVKEFEVDKEYASYLFYWHFYFVFNEKEAFRKAFWNHIDELRDVDASNSHWEISKQFAKGCKKIHQ